MGHDLGLERLVRAVVASGSRSGSRRARPGRSPARGSRRARASFGKYALEHGTVWSRRAALWAQVQGKRAAIAVRDEAIDALEELSLSRPSLRGVSDKLQELAYKDSRAIRARTARGARRSVAAERARAARRPRRGQPERALRAAARHDGCGRGRARGLVELGTRRLGRGAEHAPCGADRTTPATRGFNAPCWSACSREAAHGFRSRASDTEQSVVVPLGRTQFFDPTLFAALRIVLQDSKADPSRLELGIDERAVLSDLAPPGEVLARLRETGVRTVCAASARSPRSSSRRYRHRGDRGLLEQPPRRAHRGLRGGGACARRARRTVCHGLASRDPGRGGVRAQPRLRAPHWRAADTGGNCRLRSRPPPA